MNKVTTISLDGRAYQIEEAGYEALRAYLERARSGLAENPDKVEIVSDLERAIAEKLARFLNAHKSVVTTSEAEMAIAEMGPVDPSIPSNSSGQAGSEKHRAAGDHKKLYRIAEGARLAGVANGIAAYFDLDVTLVRVLFVILVILTGGGWIIAYIAMMILIPRATTPEQVSRAYGAPWNAQEVIDRARSGYEDIRKNAYARREEYHSWRRQWREEMRRERDEWRRAKRESRYTRHCHHSIIGELFQVAFVALIIWAIYHWLPGTQPFFNHIWELIQQGWAWIFEQLAK